MSVLPNIVENAINEFEKLPGVGPKSAARMVYHFLRSPNNDASKLGKTLIELDEKIVFCSKCFNVCEDEICPICNSVLRDSSKLCIVEEALDLVAFENSNIFNGVYFVLGGVISPADGVGADDLRFKQLRGRVEELLLGLNSEKELEVIIATNPSLEGEATAAYINDLLKDYINDKRVIITRLAMGLPTGADLEYADRLTLKRSFENRRNY